jgi:hypothetical protein
MLQRLTAASGTTLTKLMWDECPQPGFSSTTRVASRSIWSRRFADQAVISGKRYRECIGRGEIPPVG